MSRFDEPQDPVFQKLNASISFDWRLGPYDVAQSRAHASMLAARGIISEAERDELLQALDDVEHELDDGGFAFQAGDEDIHMAIERRVTEFAGPVGEAAHGPVAQRPGGDRHRHVRARPRARDGRPRDVPDGDAGRPGRGAPRLADARLHPPPTRPAGVPVPPPAGLLLDARA